MRLFIFLYASAYFPPLEIEALPLGCKGDTNEKH